MDHFREQTVNRILAIYKLVEFHDSLWAGEELNSKPECQLASRITYFIGQAI